MIEDLEEVSILRGLDIGIRVERSPQLDTENVCAVIRLNEHDLIFVLVVQGSFLICFDGKVEDGCAVFDDGSEIGRGPVTLGDNVRPTEAILRIVASW